MVSVSCSAYFFFISWGFAAALISRLFGKNGATNMQTHPAVRVGFYELVVISGSSNQMHTEAAFLQSRLCAKPAMKPRAKLTASDAIEIFSMRRSGVQATKLAHMYGISEKAIRDIWTARTWATETWHLEPSRELVLKQAGRPKGRADSKPRGTKNIIIRLCKGQLVGRSHQYFENQKNYFSSADSTAIVDVLQPPIRSVVQPERAGDAGFDVEASAPPSLDEQLGAWDLGACSPESWDPFEQDWETARAGLGMGAI